MTTIKIESGDTEEDFEVVTNEDACDEAQKTGDDDDKVTAICVNVVVDATGSMAEPITRSIVVVQTLIDFLKTALESGQGGISEDTRVFVTVVGANDWSQSLIKPDQPATLKYASATQPVKIYLNTDKCKECNMLVPLEVDRADIGASFAIIQASIDSVAKTCFGGGDNPEDYGTAINFIDSYIDRMHATVEGRVVSTTLVLTDDCNHGMTGGSCFDSFPQGVSIDTIKSMEAWPKKFECEYAPGGVWKPHDLYPSLKSLLTKSMITWVLCGNSAVGGSNYSIWTGCLAAMFEGTGSVVLNWNRADPNTINHAVTSLFCSYLAGEAVPAWITDEAYDATVEKSATEMMKKASEQNSSLCGVTGDATNTAEIISRLAIVVDLSEEVRTQVTEMTSDADAAACYRSLSMPQDSDSDGMPFPLFPDLKRPYAAAASMPGMKRLLSIGEGDLDFVEDDGMPTYRSLSAPAMGGGGGGGAAAGEEEPVYRSGVVPPLTRATPSIVMDAAPSATRVASIVQASRRRRVAAN